MITFSFDLLLLKYCLIVFQFFSFSDKSFTFRFEKSYLVLQKSVTQKFPCFSWFAQFTSVLFCYKYLLIWCMHNCLSPGCGGGRTAIKSEDFFLKGACLWRTLIEVFWKLAKLTVLLFLSFLSKSTLSSFTSNEVWCQSLDRA